MKNLTIFLFASLILSSCSVKMDLAKRKYNKGWHIQLNSNKANVSKNKTYSSPIEHDNLIASVNDITIQEINPVLDTPFEKIDKKKEECAEIIMRSGEIIKAKITEVGVAEIKYKKCNNLTGPTYAQKKSDVFMIKYPNGTTDVFKEEAPPKEATIEVKQPQDKSNSSGSTAMVIIGWVLVGLGFITVLIISILIGLVVLLLGGGFLLAGYLMK